MKGIVRWAGVVLIVGAGCTAALGAEDVSDSAAGLGEAAGHAAAIGRINAGNGAYCTGALVAANLVVTAAHCLLDPRTQRRVRPEALHFLPGYHAGAYDQHARIARYTVNPGFDANEATRNPGADWAVLVLSEALPPTSPPLRQAPDDVSADTTSVAVGYGMHRKYALSASGPCRMQLVGAMLVGGCKAERGMSGAPLINVMTGEMIGIQVAAGRLNGREVMLGVPASAWGSVVNELRAGVASSQPGSSRLQ